MKVIKNSLIPFKGFKAINLFGIIFVRREFSLTEVNINHEMIHTAQMKELLYVPFYVIYVLEWIVRLFMTGNAYRNISFEKEARANEGNLSYLDVRRHFAQWRVRVKNNLEN